MEYKEFIESLPKWDGEDRVTRLQQLVKVRAMHLPPKGKKSKEVDWFNFLVKQVVVSGKADAVIAGNKADELIAYLCPTTEALLRFANDLLGINNGTVLITNAKTLHAIAQNPRYKWIMTMKITSC